MNDVWRITTKSVTKYDPVYRDENGHYTKNEWISFSQIWEVIEREELSLESYLLAEDRYVEEAMAFFSFHKCDRVIVRNLEKCLWDR